MIGVLIDVATEPDPTRLDAAIFHVREQRSDGIRGGITIIAASAPDLIGDVTDVEDPSACPVDLSSRPVWTDVAAEGGRRHRSVPDNSEGFLVAEARNTSTDPIDDLELWLESHAVPEARIEPLVFQSVRLEAGATLRAAWPIDLGAPPAGRYLASLVASSPRHAPHRLLVDVLTGRSRDIPRPQRNSALNSGRHHRPLLNQSSPRRSVGSKSHPLRSIHLLNRWATTGRFGPTGAHR